jgi:hypothetical protein
MVTTLPRPSVTRKTFSRYPATRPAPVPAASGHDQPNVRIEAYLSPAKAFARLRNHIQEADAKTELAKRVLRAIL